MVIPVGSNINEVNVCTLADFLITLGTRVDVCGLQTSLAQVVLALLSALCLIVAESYNLNTGDVAEAHNSTGATHTQTYESHAYGLQLVGCQTEYMLLASRTFGGFHYDSTLVPMPLCAGRKGLSTCSH